MDYADLVSRLEAVTEKLEKIAGHSPTGTISDPPPKVSEMLQQYDTIIAESLQSFIKLSEDVGGTVATQAQVVKQAFAAQRDMLDVISKFKKPRTSGVLEKLLEPTADALKKAGEIKDKGRQTKQWNHLQTVSEGVQALGWVTVEKGASFVAEMIAAADFYGNKILLEYKMTDPLQVAWVKSFKDTLKALQSYVQAWHPATLAWSATGVEFTGDKSAAVTAPSPLPPASSTNGVSNGANDVKGSLFSVINSGNLTAGLKHVSKGSKTAAATSVVPATVPVATAAPAPPPAAKTIPPKFELDGKKWIIQGQGKTVLKVDKVEPKQTLYIYGCTDTTVQIIGKIGQITIDGCKGTGVVFDDIVSSVEVVNCDRVKVQSNGKLPTLSVDKSDSIEAYLSKASLDVEVYTSKISDFNVLIPSGTDDMTEIPVPQQYVHKIVNGKLTTEPTKH